MRDKAKKELKRMEALIETIGSAIRMAIETMADLNREIDGTDDDHRILKIQEAAKILQVHPNTIRNLVKAGKIAGVQGAGGKVIGITEASIADYLKL